MAMALWTFQVERLQSNIHEWLGTNLLRHFMKWETCFLGQGETQIHPHQGCATRKSSVRLNGCFIKKLMDLFFFHYPLKCIILFVPLASWQIWMYLLRQNNNLSKLNNAYKSVSLWWTALPNDVMFLIN